jgi:quinol monooxygenase YgiN
MEEGMVITVVNIHVKEDCIEDFKLSIMENARESRKEPGNLRFDVIQQTDDPTRFLLIEIYTDNQGPILHKQTKHYIHWKEIAETMMAEPRVGTRYVPVSPEESEWVA